MSVNILFGILLMNGMKNYDKEEFAYHPRDHEEHQHFSLRNIDLEK